MTCTLLTLAVLSFVRPALSPQGSTGGAAPAAPPASAHPAVAVAAPVFGDLDRSSGLPILRLRGSRRAMGHVHGRVLARQIFAGYWADFVMTAEGDLRAADRARRRLRRSIRVPAAALAELQGVLEGMRQAYGGELPELTRLGRRFDLDDLIVFNARDALRAFGCSGFTVWDRAAGDAGVITTRNFDFPISGEASVASQFVLVRHETGKVPVATVTFPGYIGAFTGVSARGVCAFMHDGSGVRARRPQGPYTPLPLKLYALLAEATPADAKVRGRKALEEVAPYPFSYLVRFVTPRVAGEKAPAQVLRVDHNPQVTENPVGDGRSITTNHSLTPARKPVAQANRWSRFRYGCIEEVLDAGIIDGRRAWTALKKCTATGFAPTLHSLTVYPEQRKLDLSLARWRRRVVPATAVTPTAIGFDALFGVAAGPVPVQAGK